MHVQGHEALLARPASSYCLTIAFEHESSAVCLVLRPAADGWSMPIPDASAATRPSAPASAGPSLAC